jgi:hypothetical protein
MEGIKESDDLKSIAKERLSRVLKITDEKEELLPATTTDQCIQDILSDDQEIIQRGVMGISYVQNNKHLTADALPMKVYNKFTQLLTTSQDQVFIFILLQLFSSMCESAIFVHKFYKARLYDALFELINKDPTIVPLKLPLSILTAMFKWTRSAAENLHEKKYVQLLIELSMNESLKESETKEVVKQLRHVVTSQFSPIKDNPGEILGIFNEIMAAPHAAVISAVAALKVYVHFRSPPELDIKNFVFTVLPQISELSGEPAVVVSSVIVDLTIEDDNCRELVDFGFFNICADNLPKVDETASIHLMKALNNIITIRELAEALIRSPLWDVLPCSLEAAVIPVKCEALRLYATYIQTHDMSVYINEIPNITALSIEIAGLELEEDKLFSAIVIANSVIRARLLTDKEGLISELEELDAKETFESIRDDTDNPQQIVFIVQSLLHDVFE